MDKSILISGSIFILVVLLASVGYYYSNLYKKKTGARIRFRQEMDPENGDSAAKEGWKGYLRQMVSRFGESLRPHTDAELSRTKIRLVRAGYYGETDPVIFFGSKVFMAILLFVLFVIVKFAFIKVLPAEKFILLMVCSATAGFFAPDLYLYRKTQERKRKIFEGFPDALDLMVVCVEAGMGLDSSIKRVGDEMSLKNKILSDEFRMLSLELRAGKPRSDALRNLAMRTNVEDVASLVTLLIQTDRFGTRVAQALRVHSDSMRSKRFLRAEEKAAKLPIKILFPLVFFILPALIITLLGPAMIKFYREIVQGAWKW
jgi:tight adherence protein C